MTDLDAVADKAAPSNIVHRQGGNPKVNDDVGGVKNKIMGAEETAATKAHSTTDSAGSAMGSTLRDAGSAVADATHQAARKIQGNPLAAGLIAFGAGLLVSSLIPPGRKEREAADALKTATESVTTKLTDAAKQVAEGLDEPAREAMENVKATASDAAQHAKYEGEAAASGVKSSATDATHHVRNG